MSEAILFRQCLGLNDSTAISTHRADTKSGKTELLACENMTVTDDGCIQKAPGLAPVLTHTLPITRVSAGKRLFFGDGFDIYEVVNGVPVNRFPVLDGPMIHTPLDARVSGGSTVYKSVDPAGAMVEAVVGTSPDAQTSVAWAPMPLFDGGFVYGAKAYVFKDKFLQYSGAHGWSYDMFNLGDDFQGHQFTILQGGAIPGLILLAHAEGVTTYLTGDLRSLEGIKRFNPCGFANGSLYSGFVSKALGFGHVFLCHDGVYMMAPDGAMTRLSDTRCEHLDKLNSSYSGAVVAGGKYLAFGDRLCVEYDFITKAVMLRPSGVSSACLLNDTLYLAYGSTVATVSENMDEASACSFTLPYSYLGAEGRKSFDCLYFTGSVDGDLYISLRDQGNPDDPERWSKVESDLGTVQGKRIKLPKGEAGSKVSFKFSTTGTMRVEEIRAVFSAGQRR